MIWHSGFLSGNFHINKFTFWTLLLGGATLFHSLLFSQLVDVSILKSISWLIVMGVLVSAWSGLDLTVREETVGLIFNGLSAVAFLSLPFVATSVGVLRNGTGFQGVLSHPQAFGPTMGILAGWAITRLMKQRKPEFKYIVLSFLAIVFVLMSEARTGALAAILGFSGALVSVRFVSGTPYRMLAPALLSKRLWFSIILLLLAIILNISSITNGVDQFVRKSGRADVGSIIAAYDLSRGSLIQQMLSNITTHPMTGIGFGLASDPESMEVERDPAFGLPLGAPVEKGVFPIMVIEELGIPLAIAVAIWFVYIIKFSARGGLPPLTVVGIIVALNLGEAILFSPGGQGLLVMILISWAATSPEVRIT